MNKIGIFGFFCAILQLLFLSGSAQDLAVVSTEDNDSSYWAQQEHIRSFDVELWLDSTGLLTVTENISTRSLGQEFQHGLVRSIPLYRKNKYGIQKKMDFEVVSILKDGETAPYFTKNEDGKRSIYIGEKDVTLSPGTYTYTITYKTKGQAGFFDGYDELYWNVTGDEWNFTILRASAAIHLPTGASVLQNQCYTGPADHSVSNCQFSQSAGGALGCEAKERIAPHEGFAIAVGFTPGLIKRPGALAGFYDDYRDYLPAAALFAALCFCYYLMWRRHGRDPEMPTVIAWYEAPDNLSPARIRYLFKRMIDNKSFATVLVQLAVKKIIRIDNPEGKKGNYMLRKLGPANADLASEESGVFKTLFGNRDRISTADSYGATFRSAKSSMEKAIKSGINIKEYFLKNTAQVWWGLLALVLVIIGYFCLAASGSDFLILFILPFVTVGGLLFVFGLLAVIKKQFFGIFLVVFGAVFGGMPLTILLTQGDSTNFSTLLFLVGCVALYCFFIYLIKAPTHTGAVMMSKILGFKMYLETAEEHRLNILNPPDHTPALFEKLLPYAMALDVENQWGEKFKDELSKLEYEPTWYTGAPLNYSHLGSSMVSGFTSAVNPAPPSSSGSSSGSSGSSSWSSGSSGGGSSSGGGGGGGGGGW